MKMHFRELAPVLGKSDLARLSGKPDGELRVAINRWIKQGKLKAAGPRSGVYYNLVNDPQWESHIAEAALKKYPSARLVGPSVLHSFGCQTQIPSTLWIAVLERPSRAHMEGIEWVERNREWFQQFPAPARVFNLPALTPADALKDGLDRQGHPGEWVPDLDDIDLDEVEEATAKLLKARPRPRP